MARQDIATSFKQVHRNLRDAETELNRPQEDVITLSACQSIRNSMRDMMLLFLSAKNISCEKNESLSRLLSRCIAVDPAFTRVDISNVGCSETDHSHCDGKYCLSVENVSHCINAANMLEHITSGALEVTL